MFDALVRLAYRGLYRCARAWWFVRRPHTRGAAVALWHDERLLLVRTSYRHRYSLPGGFVGRREDVRDAAVRELREEVGIALDATQLTRVYEETLFVEYHHDRLTIFEAVVSAEPSVKQVGRELVWAGWKTTEETASLPLLSHLRAYLDVRRQGRLLDSFVDADERRARGTTVD
jgi:ADP-ribose pyrophosphatase YjhB (NUDIX family)